MKCPYCGAEVNGDVCEYCGAEMPKEKTNTTVNIVNNYYGVDPEKKAETRSNPSSTASKANSISGANATQPKKKSRMWLWVLGWIFCFPIPLTILILRQKKMNPILRYALVAALWIFVLTSGSGANSSSSSTTATSAVTESVENTTETAA